MGGCWHDTAEGTPGGCIPGVPGKVGADGTCTALNPSRRSPGAFSGGRSRGAGIGTLLALAPRVGTPGGCMLGVPGGWAKIPLECCP
ncbi:MAG: hypothetical protein WA133_02660 [Syntrophales bacterium]